MRLRIPWGPSMVSDTKLMSPTQTIGEMSTPERGGMTFLVALSSGSVGL